MFQMDWGWGGMIFGPIMMIVVLILIVLAVRWLVESGRGGGSHNPPGQTPLDILEERFAKGEIDKVEFEERRRVLGE
jgi:putative membrane protein